MKSLSSPQSHPTENEDLSLRGRIFRMLGLGHSEPEESTEPSSSVINQLTSNDSINTERIQKALTRHPEIAEQLNQLANPDLSTEEAFDIIFELNEKYGPMGGEKRGRYSDAMTYLPNGGRLRVKLYQDLDDALTFSLSRNA